MGTEGGFCFYACFGILGFILIFLLLPETKGVSLDKMDELLSQGWDGHLAQSDSQNFCCDGQGHRQDLNLSRKKDPQRCEKIHRSTAKLAVRQEAEQP